MALYIKNATVLDWKTFILTKGHLKINRDSDPSIEFITTCPAEAYDGKGKIITKSFACAHHHAYSALACGMPAPLRQPGNFRQVLEYIWWNLDKKLDPEIIRASALVTALACARNGVTFIIDHHASPNAISGSLDTIAAAFEEVGLNHLLCYEISDRDGEKRRRQGLEETERYLNSHQGLVGLHASFTVGDQLLQAAVNLAGKYNSGIHIHVAEDPADQTECIENHGCRVIERLDNAGALASNKTLLAHCIHLDDDERKILAESRAWIAINTESNLNNQVGLFSNKGTLEQKVLLGTDGMHSDMLRNAQINHFVHKQADQLDLTASYRRLRRVHHYLEENKIGGDGANNLIILKYQSPTPVDSDNWLGHLYYGLTAADITGVICNGEWIIRDGRFTKVDQTLIYRFSNEQARRLWKKLN
jgi:cytosine/adenosine deaminase-related metal-dependent hydrolase